MRAFPARSFFEFFRNHGLLNLVDRPRWRTVRGGSQSYVEKMLRRLRNRVRLRQPVVSVCRGADSVSVVTDRGVERYDDVVFGCHADQALRTIANPSARERELLGAFGYQRNRAVLHSDPDQMPVNPRVWSAWNYMSRGDDAHQHLFVTYWMNRLQKLHSPRPLFVTLNPVSAPAPRHMIAEFEYEHPVFDQAAMQAQPRLAGIQGADRLWFCGSYFGYGFHEDAFASSLAMCEKFDVRPPWENRASFDLDTSRTQEALA